MEDELRAQAVTDLLETQGWVLIDRWLTTEDQRITNAIKNDLISLKWSEKDKWFAYYSGQASILTSLRKYIELEKSREERKQKVTNYVERFKKLKVTKKLFSFDK